MSEPFEWAVSDCAFWADIVRDLTGFDPIWDGRDYTDGPSAMIALRRAGYHSVLELLEDRLIEIPIAMAGRGDLVVQAECAPLAGPFVLDGSRAYTKALSGPIVVDRSTCTRAFTY